MWSRKFCTEKSKLKIAPCIIIIIIDIQKMLLSLADHASCLSLSLFHSNQNQNDTIPFEFKIPLIFRFLFFIFNLYCQKGKNFFNESSRIFFLAKCESYRSILWEHFICSIDKMRGRWRRVNKPLRPKCPSINVCVRKWK